MEKKIYYVAVEFKVLTPAIVQECTSKEDAEAYIAIVKKVDVEERNYIILEKVMLYNVF